MSYTRVGHRLHDLQSRSPKLGLLGCGACRPVQGCMEKNKCFTIAISSTSLHLHDLWGQGAQLVCQDVGLQALQQDTALPCCLEARPHLLPQHGGLGQGHTQVDGCLGGRHSLQAGQAPSSTQSVHQMLLALDVYMQQSAVDHTQPHADS